MTPTSKIAPALLALLLLSLGLLIFSGTVQAGEDVSAAGARVDIQTSSQGDILAVGAEVKISGSAKKDIWAAGALVSIDATAGGDIGVLGSRVAISGQAGGDLVAGGADILVNAAIGGETNIAGAKVTIAPDTVFAGQANIYGAAIAFQGQSGAELKLSGDEVTFAGQAKGGVLIEARKVIIAKGAQIHGDLTIYSQDKPEIDPSAKIDGRLTSLGLEDRKHGMEDRWGVILAAFIIPPLIFGISAFLLGVLAVWLLRGGVEQSIDMLLARPGGSILRGLVAFIVVPLAALVLITVVVGLPLGIVALLSLPALVIIGLSTAGFGMGEWLLNRPGHPKTAGGRLGLLALGLFVLLALGLIPVIGGVIIMIAVMMGLGAALITLAARLGPRDQQMMRT